MKIEPSMIAEAKGRVKVSEVVGRRVALKQQGREYAGLCPFHEERTPSFTVNDAKGFYHCFGCGAHGDQIGFLTEAFGLSFLDAAAELLTIAGMPVPAGARGAGSGAVAAKPVQRESRRSAVREFVDSLTVARFIWRRMRPARGTIVEAWLRERGVHPDGLSDGGHAVLGQLQFVERAPVGAWPVDGAPSRFLPAMVAVIEAPVADEAGETVAAFAPCGVHVTYLSRDGRQKADVKPARKMFGHTAGGAVLLGSWGAEPAAAIGSGPLTLAEGLETTLAFMAQTGGVRGAAALSLNNLQGFAEVRGKRGFVPLHSVRRDMGRSGLVWPGERSVLAGVDADMKAVEMWVQDRPGAEPVKRALSGIERSRLCGQLIQQGWSHFGTKVQIARPPMGFDFGDLAKEEVVG